MGIDHTDHTDHTDNTDDTDHLPARGVNLSSKTLAAVLHNVYQVRVNLTRALLLQVDRVPSAHLEGLGQSSRSEELCTLLHPTAAPRRVQRNGNMLPGQTVAAAFASVGRPGPPAGVR